MDKALEAMVGGMEKLVALVSDMAPQVWELYRYQVTIQGIQYCINLVGWSVLFAAGIYALKVIQKRSNTAWSDSPLPLVVCIIMVGCVFGVFHNAVYSVGRFLNPDYYALQMLMEHVK